MAKNDSKPITVKISSAQQALKEINSAIQKALQAEDSNLNKQYQGELKLQGQLSNLEDQLNLSGMTLNGPMVGLSIPTLSQLFAPLRKILQNGQYPCNTNPFTGDVAPNTTDNPVLAPITFTAASGKAGTSLIVATTAVPQTIVSGMPIYGFGVEHGTVVTSVNGNAIQLSQDLTANVIGAPGAYYSTTATDRTFTVTGGGSSSEIAVNDSIDSLGLAMGMTIEGPGVPDGAKISTVNNTANTITLDKALTGPLSGDKNAYSAIGSATEQAASTNPGAKGESVISLASVTNFLVGTQGNQLLNEEMTVTGKGINGSAQVISADRNANTITISKPLTTTAGGTYTASYSIPFSSYSTKGAILSLGSTVGLQVGDWIVGPGVSAGSFISSINGQANTITLNQAMTATANTTADAYSATPPSIVNFWVQELFYSVLAPDFRTLLANYKNTSDASLEEEMVFYIQKAVSDIVKRDITLSKLSTAAQGLSTGVLITEVQLGLLNNSLDNKITVGVDNKIDDIESMYYDSLNGFDSGVFPPPGGRDFLTNLENQIMVSIDQSIANSLKKARKNVERHAEEIQNLEGTMHEKSVVRYGIHDALFNKIAELGIQGTLLADALDNESSKAIKQNVTSLLEGTEAFKQSLTTLNATAKVEAQSILSCQSILVTFMSQFDSANEALQANSTTLGTGTKSYDHLNGTLNGAGQGNRAYLEVLIDSASDGNLSVMDDVESRSTQITAELAGLLYLANSTLVKQAPQKQVDGLDATISAQFASDILDLQKALASYATNLANYLSVYQDYKEIEDTVMAAGNVIGSVTQMLGASPSTSPKFN